MNSVVTPNQGRKDFFKIIKEVNTNKKPVLIKPLKSDEKGAILIGEDDWNAIQETLFLVNQGVDQQIREREHEGFTDFDEMWDEL